MLIEKDERVGIQNTIYDCRDAQQRKDNYADNWTEVQKKAADKLKNQLYAAYGCRPRVFLNYRKEFIAVKVMSPSPAEKSLDEVLFINKEFPDYHIVKGGIIYHIFQK